MMPLRRFKPISRSAEWRVRIVARDPVTDTVQDLTNTALTVALLRQNRHWGFCDYGRWFDPEFDCGRYQDIVLFAQTLVDNSGVFTILPGNRAAEFIFQPEDLAGLCCGPYLALVVIQDAYGTREIYREPVPILPGWSILPPIIGSGGLISGSLTDISGSVTNVSGSGPGLDPVLPSPGILTPEAVAALLPFLPTTPPPGAGLPWNDGNTLAFTPSA